MKIHSETMISVICMTYALNVCVARMRRLTVNIGTALFWEGQCT